MEATKVDCAKCGNSVTLNQHTARFALSGKSILCQDCMRGNSQHWDRANYKEYLQSDAWKTFRKRALQHYGRKCYLCGTENGQIDVHHNNYERLGHELLGDVVPLCHRHHLVFHKGESE